MSKDEEFLDNGATVESRWITSKVGTRYLCADNYPIDLLVDEIGHYLNHCHHTEWVQFSTYYRKQEILDVFTKLVLQGIEELAIRIRTPPESWTPIPDDTNYREDIEQLDALIEKLHPVRDLIVRRPRRDSD